MIDSFSVCWRPTPGVNGSRRFAKGGEYVSNQFTIPSFSHRPPIGGCRGDVRETTRVTERWGRPWSSGAVVRRAAWASLLLLHLTFLPKVAFLAVAQCANGRWFAALGEMIPLAAALIFFALKVADRPAVRLGRGWRNRISFLLAAALLHVGVLDRAQPPLQGRWTEPATVFWFAAGLSALKRIEPTRRSLQRVRVRFLRLMLCLMRGAAGGRLFLLNGCVLLNRPNMLRPAWGLALLPAGERAPPFLP